MQHICLAVVVRRDRLLGDGLTGRDSHKLRFYCKERDVVPFLLYELLVSLIHLQ